jgi:hypothetical protein
MTVFRFDTDSLPEDPVLGEPVSTTNSLLTGKNTGKLRETSAFGHYSRLELIVKSVISAKFPTPKNLTGVAIDGSKFKAVDTEHHLILTHEVTNVGSDRAQLADMAKRAKATPETDNLDVVADRGYYSSEEILACENEGVIVTLPKPMTWGAKRFGKQDFRYVAEEDVYICPAGKRLAYSFTTQEHGLVLHRYSTNVRQRCAIKHRCTTGKERRITRWEHEHILEAVPALEVGAGLVL